MFRLMQAVGRSARLTLIGSSSSWQSSASWPRSPCRCTPTCSSVRASPRRRPIRAPSGAIAIYAAHCGGRPTTAAAPTLPDPRGGRHRQGPLPGALHLLVQQTNAQAQVGGPFLNNMPPLPGTLWTGSTSYMYDVLATGQFKICGTGDGVSVDSNGTPSPPRPARNRLAALTRNPPAAGSPAAEAPCAGGP